MDYDDLPGVVHMVVRGKRNWRVGNPTPSRRMLFEKTNIEIDDSKNGRFQKSMAPHYERET